MSRPRTPRARAAPSGHAGRPARESRPRGSAPRRTFDVRQQRRVQLAGLGQRLLQGREGRLVHGAVAAGRPGGHGCRTSAASPGPGARPRAAPRTLGPGGSRAAGGLARRPRPWRPRPTWRLGDRLRVRPPGPRPARAPPAPEPPAGSGSLRVEQRLSGSRDAQNLPPRCGSLGPDRPSDRAHCVTTPCLSFLSDALGDDARAGGRSTGSPVSPGPQGPGRT